MEHCVSDASRLLAKLPRTVALDRQACQKILAQEHCSRPSESLGGATSFDEIRENEAAALRRALRDAVRAYTAYFRAQFIKMKRKLTFGSDLRNVPIWR